MPNFRVAGVVKVYFVHELEAEDMEDAENKVNNMRLDAFDYQLNDAETDAHTVIMIDEDGVEVEDND